MLEVNVSKKDFIGFVIILAIFVLIIFIFDFPRLGGFVAIGTVAVVNIIIFGLRSNKNKKR